MRALTLNSIGLGGGQAYWYVTLLAATGEPTTPASRAAGLKLMISLEDCKTSVLLTDFWFQSKLQFTWSTCRDAHRGSTKPPCLGCSPI